VLHTVSFDKMKDAKLLPHFRAKFSSYISHVKHEKRQIQNYICKFQGQAPDTEIGRVYVYDLDDWDLADKKFYWDGPEHPRFKLNEDTGMITMRPGTRDGK
jgi:hypothetical protein